MSGIGVHVDTPVEHGSSILANTGTNHCFATWMVLDEVGNIVNDTCNSNKTTTILGLVDVIIPFHDWKLVKWDTPVKFGSLLVKLLLLLLDTALLNFVGTELLEIVGKTKLLHRPDEPFGWVILVPLDSIAVVGWEFVVEIVVSFSKSDQGSQDVVTWGVAVIEWLVTKPMSKGIDTEGGLLNEEDTEDATIDESTEPVTPAETCNKGWEDQTHEEDDLEVVSVLPDDDGIFVEIRDVCSANSFRVLLHDHPSEVRVHEALADRVRILLRVCVSVMCSVISGPPSY